MNQYLNNEGLIKMMKPGFHPVSIPSLLKRIFHKYWFLPKGQNHGIMLQY
jgi:hypothetical protein